MSFHLSTHTPELPTEIGEAGAVHFHDDHAHYALYRAKDDLWIIEKANTPTTEFVVEITGYDRRTREFDAFISDGPRQITAYSVTATTFFTQML